MGFDLCFLPASPSTRQFKPCRILLPETIGLSVAVTIRPVEDDGDVPSFTPFSNIIVKYDGDDVIMHPRHRYSLGIILEDGMYTELRIPGTEHISRELLQGSSEPFIVKITLAKC
ncbi:hypothetical protein PILCRDRAFT_4129 [Piloderma croceum F 1598]|uniref:Uncharacterized protein n=1 Tax=Piloderma croceum (strain F 1598) TaxID=765440 RepID=A0A0C3G875_PILCF|nr:hypothetical protein PILCRDRAFT_4129 [Piloderma croceum F 1598]